MASGMKEVYLSYEMPLLDGWKELDVEDDRTGSREERFQKRFVNSRLADASRHGVTSSAYLSIHNGHLFVEATLAIVCRGFGNDLERLHDDATHGERHSGSTSF